jgi:hypothetical protein
LEKIEPNDFTLEISAPSTINCSYGSINEIMRHINKSWLCGLSQKSWQGLKELPAKNGFR